jgi:hypothetical protein
VRYVAEGKPRLKAQCHCRECQYISGGAPNMFPLPTQDPKFVTTCGTRSTIPARCDSLARDDHGGGNLAGPSIKRLTDFLPSF